MGWVVHCLRHIIYLITSNVCLERLSIRYCSTNNLSEWEKGEMNVKDCTVDSTHFYPFLSPHAVLSTHWPEGVPLYRGGGVPYEDEDRLAIHEDGWCTRPQFPHPMYIASRMSHHLVVKPQSYMVKQTTMYKLLRTIQKYKNLNTNVWVYILAPITGWNKNILEKNN